MIPVGAALLIDQAWLGHAAEGSGAWGALMPGVYGVHVLAAAAWLGGLPPLLFALRETRGQGDEATRRQTLDLLLRFSVIAMPAVALIVASGLGNVGFRVGGSVGRLFMTNYGSVFCAKAALVVAMLALACYNQLVATAADAAWSRERKATHSPANQRGVGTRARPVVSSPPRRCWA